MEISQNLFSFYCHLPKERATRAVVTVIGPLELSGKMFILLIDKNGGPKGQAEQSFSPLSSAHSYSAHW